MASPSTPFTAAPDFECLDVPQTAPAARAGAPDHAPARLLLYAGLGLYLGVLFVLSEVASWYRIQEMFRFDSFHMYGVIGSAVAVAALSRVLIRRLGFTTADGAAIRTEPKAWTRPGTRYWAGGTLFGLGWGLLGACPGPIFALLGSGLGVMAVALLAAMTGTWAYALVRDRLPH